MIKVAGSEKSCMLHLIIKNNVVSSALIPATSKPLHSAETGYSYISHLYRFNELYERQMKQTYQHNVLVDEVSNKKLWE